MKKNREQLIKHCTSAIEKSVENAGGIYAFVNQFIVVPDEESSLRVLDDACEAVFLIDDLLLHDDYYFEVRKIHIEANGTLTVQLFVVECALKKSGEIFYKNNQCSVSWESARI